MSNTGKGETRQDLTEHKVSSELVYDGRLLKVRREIQQGWGDVASVQLFSAPKREGVEEAQQVLAAWLGLLEEDGEEVEQA